MSESMTAKKLALCIGINNYPGTGNDLNGCVNDAGDWATLLMERDFGVTTMLDGDATKFNMIDGIMHLLSDCKNGDTAVLTYSGHGTWVPDTDGDEMDRRDEALCPWDCIETGEVLTDDELYYLFTGHRARGVRLIFVSDSCHSGTVSRFMGPLNAMEQNLSVGRKVRYMAPELFLSDRRLSIARRVELAPKPKSRSRSSALLFAGCKDSEYSYDAWFSGRANGAFTYAMLQSMRSAPHTYRELWQDVRNFLPSVDYPQTPLLDGPSDWKNWPGVF